MPTAGLESVEVGVEGGPQFRPPRGRAADVERDGGPAAAFAPRLGADHEVPGPRRHLVPTRGMVPLRVLVQHGGRDTEVDGAGRRSAGVFTLALPGCGGRERERGDQRRQDDDGGADGGHRLLLVRGGARTERRAGRGPRGIRGTLYEAGARGPPVGGHAGAPTTARLPSNAAATWSTPRSTASRATAPTGMPWAVAS